MGDAGLMTGTCCTRGLRVKANQMMPHSNPERPGTRGVSSLLTLEGWFVTSLPRRWGARRTSWKRNAKLSVLT
jgi:hypothetical protein